MIHWLLGFLIAGACAVSAQSADQLESLRFKFEVAEEALSKGKRELDAKYESQLKALGKRSQEAGALDQVINVRAELRAFREGETELVRGFAELERLQVLYRQGLERVVQATAGKRKQLYTQHVTDLKTVEASLTREGNLAKARAVKAGRETLEAKLAALDKQRVQMANWSARGRFHISVDDKVSVYLDGKKAFGMRIGKHQSTLQGLEIGDFVLCSVRNSGGGPKRFKMVFVSSDGRYRIDFKREHFTELDEVMGDRRVITEEDFAAGSRDVVRVSKSNSGNPFDFANNADWVWGRGGHTLLATKLTQEMVTEVGR